MFLAAVRRPSLVRKGLGPGGADGGSAALQDAGDVRRLHPPDQLAALDQALVALIDRVHIDAVVQGGPDDGPDRRVHPGASPPLVRTPMLDGAERASDMTLTQLSPTSVDGTPSESHAHQSVLIVLAGTWVPGS